MCNFSIYAKIVFMDAPEDTFNVSFEHKHCARMVSMGSIPTKSTNSQVLCISAKRPSGILRSDRYSPYFKVFMA
uniref:Uncharacterized protein n=1 Tax=Acrobeloides nanus TaxID=290746 RepID=A0A914D1T1_9BILA